MGFNASFWLFLAAVTVASITFVTIVVWVESRRKERHEYYKFEFRKKLVEAGKMDSEGVASLMRYEHELGLSRGREKLLVAGFVILGVGIGACVTMSFFGAALWKLGFLPVSIGLSMLVYGFLFAAKPDPGPAPAGWSPDPHQKD